MRTKKPLIERYFRYVTVSTNCWEWVGALDKQGYGVLSVRPGEMGTGYPSRNRIMGAHRIAYYLMHGTLPPGAHLDHLCHSNSYSCKGGPTCPHRRCVNPNHLEIVTASENALRCLNSPWAINREKTHCPQGHEYTEENTYIDKESKRHCRTCNRLRARNYRGVTNPLPVPALRTHCPQGHPYAGENLYINPSGRRICRECARVGNRRYKESKRAT